MELCSERNLRQCKAIKLRFLHNIKGFWGKYRFLIYLLIIAAVLDCITTHHFMSLAGIHFETHPHIRLISFLCGPFWGPAFGKIAQVGLGITVIIYVRKYASLLLLTASGLYIMASLFNLISTGFLDDVLINMLVL